MTTRSKRREYQILDADYGVVRRFQHSSLDRVFAVAGKVALQGQRGDVFLVTSTVGRFTRSKPLYCHARIERLEDSV